jgi:hypothetical protein
MDTPTEWRKIDKVHRRSVGTGGALCGATRRRVHTDKPLQLSDKDNVVTCGKCRERLRVLELIKLNAGKRGRPFNGLVPQS